MGQPAHAAHLSATYSHSARGTCARGQHERARLTLSTLSTPLSTTLTRCIHCTCASRTYVCCTYVATGHHQRTGGASNRSDGAAGVAAGGTGLWRKLGGKKEGTPLGAKPRRTKRVKAFRISASATRSRAQRITGVNSGQDLMVRPSHYLRIDLTTRHLSAIMTVWSKRQIIRRN